MSHCPHCGSDHTASRRQLFHFLMSSAPLPSSFSWYDEKAPGALPPKSMFLQLLLIAALALVPAGTLTLTDTLPMIYFQGLAWMLVSLLAAFLLGDVCLTYRDYREWAGERLCGDCRASYADSFAVLAAN